MTKPNRTLQQHFAQLVELDSDARRARIDALSADDPDLAAELRDLLSIDAVLGDQDARPAVPGLSANLDQIEPRNVFSGLIVPPYRVGALLGQGGMGSVYRAERTDGEVRQTVAIKFVRRELVDASALRRFQAERDTLASLDHPNIARLIDARTLPDGTPCFIMEFVDGLPINRHAREAALDARARIGLVLAVCDAIKHAHRNLVVHRDLKPGNILVDRMGRPRLLDFGIAKSLAPDSGADTETAQRYFTPAYAAPEQLLGDAITVGCDIYALGLLLYELLSGQPPFDFTGLSAGQAERLVVSVPPPPPSARATLDVIPASALRGDLDGIVLRCLRKSANERYGSVDQLEDDLRRYLNGQPVTAVDSDMIYRARKFVGRHRVAVAIACAAALAMSVALVALLLQNRALMHERDLSQQALAILKESFLSADPMRTSGAETRAGQILDAAHEHIDGLLPEQPELFAGLAESMAEVDVGLSRTREAVDLLAKANDPIVAAMLDSQLRIRLLVLEAQAKTSLEEYDEAESALIEAERLGGSAQVEWRIAKARLLSWKGDYAAAGAMTDRIVADLADKPATDRNADAARLLQSENVRLAGNNQKSLDLLDAMLVWQRGSLPEQHALVSRVRLRRLAPLRALGRIDESIAQAERLRDIVIAQYGADSTPTATVLGALGRSLHAAGRFEDALTVSGEALRVWQVAQGNDHGNTLRVMFNHALAEQDVPGHRADALKTYAELMPLAESRHGAQSKIVVYYRMHYGKTLQVDGNHAGVVALLAGPEASTGLDRSEADNREEYLGILEASRRVACLDSEPRAPACQRAIELATRFGEPP